MLKPVIIVHGGAWNVPDELVEAHIKGVEKAVSIGMGYFRKWWQCIRCSRSCSKMYGR
ncbi:MAG: hypothetical protein ACP6IS_02530 [Candidatus Asgardarchaeia archaeon]